MKNNSGIRWPKLRKCQNCGYTAIWRGTSHKVWCKIKKKSVYCGTMRVVIDDRKRNIIGGSK